MNFIITLVIIIIMSLIGNYFYKIASHSIGAYWFYCWIIPITTWVMSVRLWIRLYGISPILETIMLFCSLQLLISSIVDAVLFKEYFSWKITFAAILTVINCWLLTKGKLWR